MPRRRPAEYKLMGKISQKEGYHGTINLRKQKRGSKYFFVSPRWLTHTMSNFGDAKQEVSGRKVKPVEKKRVARCGTGVEPVKSRTPKEWVGRGPGLGKKRGRKPFIWGSSRMALKRNNVSGGQRGKKLGVPPKGGWEKKKRIQLLAFEGQWGRSKVLRVLKEKTKVVPSKPRKRRE